MITFSKILLRISFFCLGLLILILLFYAEENWRGKRDWQNCQKEVKAAGDSLDWKDYIPPAVPDDQNFFKAPKMSEWFVKSSSLGFTNELTKQLIFPKTNSVIVAKLTAVPFSTNSSISENSDLVLRYSSFGKAVFLGRETTETNTSSPDFIIPLIQFEDVPLTTGIENLARQARLKYSLDPKIGYNHPDPNGQIKPEPVVSIRWENITAEEALLTILNRYDLQLIKDPKSDSALITIKNGDDPEIYIADDVQEKVENLFFNVLGTNIIGPASVVLLTKSPNEIQPARIILQSQQKPDETEIADVFTQFFRNAKKVSPKIYVNANGKDSFQIELSASSVTNYLAWSDQFKPDFDKIREALKRPYSRMEGNYSNIFSAPIPNFVLIRIVAQTLAQRAQCDFLSNQPEDALHEITLIKNLCLSLEEKPTGKPMLLVTAMIYIAVMGLYVDTIKRGIELRAWQEPQLQVLQNELKEINLTPFIFNALKIEPFIICNFCEITFTNNFFASFRQVPQIPSPFPIPMPKGWVYQNMINAVRLDRMPLKGFDLTNNTISPQILDRAADIINTWSQHKSLFKFYLIIPVTSFLRGEQITAYNQTLVNEAQIACALERYHLAHGNYPETLDVLAPQFIEKIPHDIIGGAPLHYRLAENGKKFVLYSIGWNEKDDGGLDLSDNGKVNYTNGDWVWKN